MEQTSTGDLVKVATKGPQVDGVVFEVPSANKVIVAVIDPKRGPVLRTVELSALTERTEAGPDDRALQLLIKRTSPTARGSARGDAQAGAGREGHTRVTMHRTTGK